MVRLFQEPSEFPEQLQSIISRTVLFFVDSCCFHVLPSTQEFPQVSSMLPCDEVCHMKRFNETCEMCATHSG